MRRILLYLILLIFIAGCRLPSPYYQKAEPIPQNAWGYSYRPTFKFNITDTNAIYHTFFIIRHTTAYPYNNLWMWLYIKGPGDSLVKKERVNVLLAGADGRWLGRGMGDVYEERVRLYLGDSVRFDRKGTYQLALEQNMRVDPLPEILHVGLRVENVGEKENK